MRTSRRAAVIVLATCQPGLEPVVADELGEVLGGTERLEAGLLRFRTAVRGAEVLDAVSARTADDLYAQIWSGGGRGDLRTWLDQPALPLPGDVLAAHRSLLAAARRRPSGRFKATCFAGSRKDLRRREVEHRIERRILAAQPTWRVDAERPDAEVVLYADAAPPVACLRLTDPSFRHRGYGRYRAALSPTVAAAMVRLSGVSPDDRFLDPCCGGGTILLERAAAGRFTELLGGDIDPAAVATARANFGNRHRPWRLEVWDARRLPLPDAAADRVVTNLPFGAQVQVEGGPERFAAEVLAEAARVLRPGGRAVVLAVPNAPGRPPRALRRLRVLPVHLVGRSVAVTVYEREAEGAGVS